MHCLTMILLDPTRATLTPVRTVCGGGIGVCFFLGLEILLLVGFDMFEFHHSVDLLQGPCIPQKLIDYTEVGPSFLESSGGFSACM